MGLLRALGLKQDETKRGIIYLEAEGAGLLNKGVKYEGGYEVKILDETEELFKIEVVDLYHPPMWVLKNIVLVIDN